MNSLTERYLSSGGQPVQGAKSFIEFIELMNAYLPPLAPFSEWRKWPSNPTKPASDKTIMRSRSCEYLRQRDDVVRLGFSYGNDRFYQADAMQAKVDQTLVVTEQEVAITSRDRLLRRRPGEVVLRMLRVEASFELAEVVLPQPLISREILNEYEARFGRVGLVGWASDTGVGDTHAAFAFRSDGNVSAAYMYDNGNRDVVVCPLPPATGDIEGLEHILKGSMRVLRSVEQ